MTPFLRTWLVASLVLLPIDFVWLKGMQWFYRREMGQLLLDEPRLGIAAVFYVLLAAGIAWFTVLPNISAQNGTAAAIAGAFLGAIAYGTYDATNYATLKGYPMSVTIVDWMWGTFLCGITAWITWMVVKRFNLV
jgi:uncharacterized membrane protein